MRIFIRSREELDDDLKCGLPDEKNAIISFYDEGSKPIELGGYDADLIAVEIDDIDFDEKGFDYYEFFPQADEVAEFIIKALKQDMSIICQCEYGQSRSAGCAAAIMEYFFGSGMSIFTDEEYYPNKAVFSKIYEALINARLGMSEDEINALLPEGRKIHRKEIISDIMNRLRKTYEKETSKGYVFWDDRTQWCFITSDGTMWFYCSEMTNAVEEFLTKYSEDDILFAWCGTLVVGICSPANYSYDSESGFSYCYGNMKYGSSPFYFEHFCKKYNVTSQVICD